MNCVSGQVASVEDNPLELGVPPKARSNLCADLLEACTQDPVPEIKMPVLVPIRARVSCCLIEQLFHSSEVSSSERDQSQKAQVIWP